MKRTMVARPFVGITLGLLITLVTFNALAAQPEFSFVDINGETVDFKEYRGKWVVVNYWATWCPPCLEEIPELVHFHEAYKDSKAVVVGFNMEEKSPQLLSAFVEENMMTYPVVPMSDEMALFGDVPGLPTTYVLDPTGKPVAMQVGEVTAEMLEEFINRNNSQ